MPSQEQATQAPKAKTKATGSANLHKARSAKNDEFYTQFCDIKKELQHYKRHFSNKVIYCNCDDPTISNFYKFFKNNFSQLNLKKLIATHYTKSPAVAKTYKIEITLVNGWQQETITPVAGDGDFRSKECEDLLTQADIVCTNPPFSLFREYVAQLVASQKEFLIVGSENAITYKDVFKLIIANRLWLGVNHVKEFATPNAGTQKLGNVCWFTNLQHTKRNDELILRGKYNPTDYPKYDNYNAIDVSKVCDIPADYDGFMGVPITFLGKHNPAQFELLGIMNTGEENNGIRYANTPHGRPTVNGREIYLRLILQKRDCKAAQR